MSIFGLEGTPKSAPETYLPTADTHQEESFACKQRILSMPLHSLIIRYAEIYGPIKIGQEFTVRDGLGNSYDLTRVKGGYLFKRQIYGTPA